MYLQRRSISKYNAKSTIYNGIIYHSKKEAGRAQELDLLLKAKEIKKWERQIPIDLKVNGEHICKYYVDFKVTDKHGIIIWEEVKGFMTEVYRLKRKIFEATYLKEHPDEEYVVIT